MKRVRKTAEITHSLLKQVLEYFPESGVFKWKDPTPIRDNSFRENLENVTIGDIAGHKSLFHGYITIGLLGKSYYAHRLAWFYMKGEWPSRIDHIDRNRANNSFVNLREVNASQNTINSAIRIDNTSGCSGITKVVLSTGSVRWRAHISINKKSKYLGSKKSFEEALAIRQAAEKEHYGEYSPNCIRCRATVAAVPDFNPRELHDQWNESK